ncbi:MAG: response regulator, partial [Proteobacteria bacterium]|nr:response regulator [Pseudomonadota bacterium]
DLTKQEEGLILLVEDDHEVRTFVSRALKVKGYTVLDAEHGLEALKIMDRGLDIDLLLTDIVLPGGMDGREVAKEFATRYPRAKILYSSGYTGKTLTEGGRLPDGVELLSKPYDPSELFDRISALLKG